jgi:UDP-N-acetylmuramoyl-tripeptide--D-alanyl-D-alanine ligase
MSLRPAITAGELAQWTGGAWEPAAPFPPGECLAGVSQDTRQMAVGQVYVALRGPRFDGHAFLDEAFRRGAAAAIVSDSHPGRGAPERPLLRVDDPARALRAAARAYRHKLDPHVVGVTGSVGKTTVKELAAQMLASDAPTARTPGNWNNDIGLPLALLAMPAGTRYGVFEVGMNHAGELAALCDLLRPRWGVVTNVGPVHMEFFQSVEDIAREKATLLRSLPADGFAVLPRDSLFFPLLREACACATATVSERGPADYVLAGRNAATGEIVVRDAAAGEERALRAPSASAYNALNTLMAAAVARRAGLSWEQIQWGLDRYAPLPMRWQQAVWRGARVVNDAYNANPLSMRAAIRAFAEEPAPGRRWLLLAGMLELGAAERDEHLRLGAFVAEGMWEGLLTVGAAGDLVALGAESAGMTRERIHRCADNAGAARLLRKVLAPGDAVLLKGSRGAHLEEVGAALAAAEDGP